MKLKNRLLIAFFVIIIAPIGLTTIALMAVTQYQLQAIEKSYNVPDLTYENLSNSLPMISKATLEDYEEIQKEGKENPDQFLDENILEEWNQKLEKKHSYLIVRKGNEMIYPEKDQNSKKIFENLPDYGEYVGESDTGVYIGNKVNAFVKQTDVIFSDQTKGSIFIMTSATEMIPQVKRLIVELIIAIIVILVCTSAALTVWIYRGIHTPLNRLRTATQNIKEGNLDFTLEVEGEDEISELCRDFEDMRKRLKETAEENIVYDKESKELISNISHDLKTPITAVKGYVEGIMDGVANTPEKMERYIKTIYNKANEMDRLINELTFYSKIDTDRIPYTFNKINVASYFNDCKEEVALDLADKNIDLAYFNYVDEDVMVIADAEQLKRVINVASYFNDCKEEVALDLADKNIDLAYFNYVDEDVMVIADAEQLKRVINNIIGNSVKYMDKEKGYINIRIKDVGDFIQVEIEDNGRGIAVKDLPLIFDRFYRADASRNSALGGSGIGLSIVRKIIEDHGGKIWANSKPGTGTSMFFVLRKYQEVKVDE